MILFFRIQLIGSFFRVLFQPYFAFFSPSRNGPVPIPLTEPEPRPRPLENPRAGIGIDISPMPVRHGQTPARRLRPAGKRMLWRAGRGFIVRDLAFRALLDLTTERVFPVTNGSRIKGRIIYEPLEKNRRASGRQR